MSDTQTAVTQTITVTVEVTAGLDPATVVEAINEWIGDEPMFVVSTPGVPAHAVEGEPYRAYQPGTAITVGQLTLVK